METGKGLSSGTFARAERRAGNRYGPPTIDKQNLALWGDRQGRGEVGQSSSRREMALRGLFPEGRSLLMHGVTARPTGPTRPNTIVPKDVLRWYRVTATQPRPQCNLTKLAMLCRAIRLWASLKAPHTVTDTPPHSCPAPWHALTRSEISFTIKTVSKDGANKF